MQSWIFSSHSSLKCHMLQNVEEIRVTHIIESLSQIGKHHVQWVLLIHTLFLKLAYRENHVQGRATSTEAALTLRQHLVRNTLQSWEELILEFARDAFVLPTASKQAVKPPDQHCPATLQQLRWNSITARWLVILHSCNRRFDFHCWDLRIQLVKDR